VQQVSARRAAASDRSSADKKDSQLFMPKLRGILTTDCPRTIEGKMHDSLWHPSSGAVALSGQREKGPLLLKPAAGGMRFGDPLCSQGA
jgi:hypothetical protein